MNMDKLLAKTEQVMEVQGRINKECTLYLFEIVKELTE